MDITTLTAAFESIKTVAGLARATASAAVDHQIKDKLIDIQQGILDGQGQLANAVEKRLTVNKKPARGGLGVVIVRTTP